MITSFNDYVVVVWNAPRRGESTGGMWGTMAALSEQKPYKVISVGLLVEDSKFGLKMVSHVALEDNRNHRVFGELVIPRDSVQSVVRLFEEPARPPGE